MNEEEIQYLDEEIEACNVKMADAISERERITNWFELHSRRKQFLLKIKDLINK